LKTNHYIEDTEDLYQNAPCGYLSTWSDGAIFNINNTLLRWLGYQREEVVSGKSFQDLLGMGGKIFFETHLIPLLQMQGEVSEINIELKGKETIRIPTLINLKRMQSQEEKKVVFRISVINITQRNLYEKELIKTRKEAEEKSQRLRELVQNLEQFALTSSNGLQAPVKAISDMVSLMEMNDLIKPGFQGQRAFSMIKKNSSRMKRMIMDLLEYSYALDKELAFVKVNLNEISQEALKMLEQEIMDNNAHFIIPDLPDVLGAPDQLVRLFYHLFRNAIKYRSEAVPVVKVTYVKSNGFIRVMIKDNGIGMEPEDLWKIFNFMERLHDYESIPGTGLGLPICKKIVENHGGNMGAESAVGNGSLFYFTLPGVK
jgi:PAS domain S-box-containing protein